MRALEPKKPVIMAATVIKEGVWTRRQRRNFENGLTKAAELPGVTVLGQNAQEGGTRWRPKTMFDAVRADTQTLTVQIFAEDPGAARRAAKLIGGDLSNAVFGGEAQALLDVYRAQHPTHPTLARANQEAIGYGIEAHNTAVDA